MIACGRAMATSSLAQTSLRIAAILPREGIWREVLLGFSTIATARAWRVELSYPMYHFRERTNDLAGSLRFLRPHAALILEETCHLLKLPELRDCLVICVGQDLNHLGVASIIPDDEAVGREAASHLIERGFRSLGAFGMASEAFARRRADAFAQAATEAGATVYPWPEAAGGTIIPSHWQAWFDHARPWIEHLPKPAGIFAGCDSWGIILQQILRDARWRIPEDVAIVTVDNDPVLCELALPPLSSVEVPWRRMGVEAALAIERALCASPAQPPQSLTMLPPLGVAVRRSSDTTAASDPDVADALALIRGHADKPLSAADVLRRIPIYRQRLQQKFRRQVGRTIVDEIRRVHLEQAKRLLVTTDLGMSKVAQLSGFANASRLSVNFHRETGLTPTQWRRQFGDRATHPLPAPRIDAK